MMIRWDKRPREVAYLLNPAFCARLIYIFVYSYCSKLQGGVPVSLLFLVLPITLGSWKSGEVNVRTSLTSWISKHSEFVVTFPKRASSHIPYCKEAIELLSRTGFIFLNEYGKFEAKKSKVMLEGLIGAGFDDYFKRAQYLGRAMANINDEVFIYASLGVRP